MKIILYLFSRSLLIVQPEMRALFIAFAWPSSPNAMFDGWKMFFAVWRRGDSMMACWILKSWSSARANEAFTCGKPPASQSGLTQNIVYCAGVTHMRCAHYRASISMKSANLHGAQPARRALAATSLVKLPF